MSNIFRPKTPTPPPAPEVTPPAPMPDSSSEGVIEANRRAQQKIMARAGRSSTILTAPENRGGAAYSATRLGTSV
jgi:hypothetical protein